MGSLRGPREQRCSEKCHCLLFVSLSTPTRKKVAQRSPQIHFAPGMLASLSGRPCPLLPRQGCVSTFGSPDSEARRDTAPSPGVSCLASVTACDLMGHFSLTHWPESLPWGPLRAQLTPLPPEGAISRSPALVTSISELQGLEVENWPSVSEHSSKGRVWEGGQW